MGYHDPTGCRKGYWQKNKGFDSTELSWLWAYGARTHFIHSGIRYFSFSLTRVFSVPAWDYPALFSRLLFSIQRTYFSDSSI